MKMTTGGWIGIGGGIAGIIVAIMSVIMTVPGPEGIYITLGIVAFFGGMFFLFWKLLIGPAINASRLMKHGISGKAVITAINDTGVTVNNSPQVKLTLEVKNSFGQRYTTTCRVLVSRINPFAYQPGMEVPVKIDPKNEKNVVIDTSIVNRFAGDTAINNMAANPLANQYQNPEAIAGLKTELEQLEASNKSILATGKSARAIVKKYNWLGAYINGNNPYVELELEILPDSAPAFSGKAKGVIGEVSIPKFQPGEEVFVKYDLYDNSKVSIEHS